MHRIITANILGRPYSAAAAIVCLMLSLTAPSVARADAPLHIYAAGSLRSAVTDLLAASAIPPDLVAPPVFGPAGLLRARIEQGAPADFFASADMGQPQQLVQRHGNHKVRMFARNRMCALARRSLGVTPDNLLDRMLDPSVRLVTSTPGADPGGDYAWAIFARAGKLRPGAQNALEAKALKLLGSSQSTQPRPGHTQVQDLFLTHAADLMLSYCSGAPAILRVVPDLVSVKLPPGLAVQPVYGMIVLTDSSLAERFAAFIISQRGQAILTHSGLLPAASVD